MICHPSSAGTREENHAIKMRRMQNRFIKPIVPEEANMFILQSGFIIRGGQTHLFLSGLVKMNMLLLVLLVTVSSVQCTDFLDDPPSDYTVGKGFEDCASRFSAIWKIPFIQGLGGTRAYQGEFQHMAAIGWTRSENKIDYLCGGSLITLKFVLTAAHCAVDYDNLPPDTVRLGDTDLASTDDDESAQQIPIARFIKHPQYRESRKYFDIALVELANVVDADDAVCVACVWREPEAPTNLLDAVGFGALGFGEKLSPTLQKVQLRALSAVQCAERIPANRRQMPEGLRDDQLCAHSKTMDTCEGDSGGPLQTEALDVFGETYPLVVGVVSFGTPCIEGSTGVYTRVSSYVDWIEKEVNQSLSYKTCTGVGMCSRKRNVAVSATVRPKWPINRVGLLWEREETDIYQCGGLLIDFQYVLTSAECFTSSKGFPKFVSAAADGDRVPIADVFVHPQYRRKGVAFDIALIKLRKYANLEETQPICPMIGKQLAQSSHIPVGVGASTVNRRFHLQYFNSSATSYVLQISAREQCTLDKKANWTDLVCIKRNISLVPDTCKVDFGGPVLIEEREDVYRAYGVISRRTKGCGGDAIFTEIAPHLQWLESIMFKQLNQWLVFAG
ncbi:serine protease 53-like [Anopheles arabiensis]|uniref:serine protease 53-like n=1 Tax=Anopheles arabiensis TaxID=7173 RepID=UPI001AACD64C|nr:serine protease 53-like [Anopheles arabiensis]